MFTAEQIKLLTDLLDPQHVKKRQGAGRRTLSYLEGHHVIDMANEVFGFGNWDAETVEMKREHDPVHIPPTEEHPKGGIVVTYSARVRVTVYSPDGSRKVVRERSGGHRGFGPTVGQAVEDCIKAAETDATKRAFVTFGNIFGLALYDKEQRNVGTPEAASRRQEAALAPIDEGFDQSAALAPYIKGAQQLAPDAIDGQLNDWVRIVDEYLDETGHGARRGLTDEEHDKIDERFVR
jgi:DNA recombination protein Rad52